MQLNQADAPQPAKFISTGNLIENSVIQPHI